MIDKSIRPDYVMQGKVRNYLGKQKMVKAPVKWKSGLNKPETELAYITKAEKDLILKADIHGSLKKGPNIGPSGIMSLDSWGDRSGGQAGSDVSRDTDRGGGGSPDPRTTYSYSPPAPAPAPKIDVGFQEALRKQNIEKPIVDVGFQEALRKQNIEKPIVDVGFQEALRKQKIKDAEEKAKKEILNDPRVDEGFKRYIRQPETFETPDRDGIFSKLDPKEMAKNQAKTMVRNKIMKELGLAGFNPLIGIGSWLMGKFAPGKKAALTEKLKSTIKPAFDPDSLLGTADWQGEQKRNKTFHEPKGDGDGPKTIAEQITQGAGLAEGQKMLGLDDKQIQQIYQGRDLLSTTIEAGVYQGRQLTAEQIKILQNKRMEFNNLIDAIEKAQAPVNVAYGGRIDKALGGRSRDI